MTTQQTSESIALAEISLFQSVRTIRETHGLESLAIAFYDYETTIQWSYNADTFFHAASTMKLAVLLGVFRQITRGELALDAPVHVRNRFTSIINCEPFMLNLDDDSDPEVFGNLGKTLTVRELAFHMITTSSNLATNLLIDVVGIEVIQHALDELEIPGVKVIRGVEDQAAFEAGLNNEVTANGLLKLLKVIADEKAYSQEASVEMKKILFEQQFKSGIPAGLPHEARVAHKTGNISTVHHDAGIVYLDGRKPYVLVALTQFAPQVGRSGAVAAISHDIHMHLAKTAHARE
ncbi:MAG TPA: serine hydrolase [Thermoanaerobaculia bacterium]